MRVFAVLVFALTASGALAEEPDHLGTFDDWEAASYRAPDSKVCFAYSVPKKSRATRKVDRGEVRFIVTNYPGKKVRGEVSTIIGYDFKEGSAAKLVIDEQTFDMFPVKDMAWAGDTDRAIVAAMKAGKTMTFSGVSRRGTETTDSYSLDGLTAAIEKINDACR